MLLVVELLFTNVRALSVERAIARGGVFVKSRPPRIHVPALYPAERAPSVGFVMSVHVRPLFAEREIVALPIPSARNMPFAYASPNAGLEAFIATNVHDTPPFVLYSIPPFSPATIRTLSVGLYARHRTIVRVVSVLGVHVNPPSADVATKVEPAPPIARFNPPNEITFDV